MTDSLWPHQAAHQASLSMEFSRQECWSMLPFHSPENLPDPGIKPGSPSLRADSLPSEPPGKRFQRPVLSKRLMQCVWVLAVFPFAQVLSTCHVCFPTCNIISILSISSFWTNLEDSEYILGRLGGLVLLGAMSQRLWIYLASLVSPRYTSLHLARKQWSVTPAQCGFDWILSSCQNGS